jgi:very-short-patch-repair endonuclease
MNTLRWWYYEYQRLKRLARPEPSARALIDAVGAFWLWRHGTRREFKIKLWATSPGWYCVDLAVPHRLKAIEADGSVHSRRRQQDVARDHRLGELGWQTLRINDEETRSNPRAVRRRVRAFIKA